MKYQEFSDQEILYLLANYEKVVSDLMRIITDTTNQIYMLERFSSAEDYLVEASLPGRIDDGGLGVKTSHNHRDLGNVITTMKMLQNDEIKQVRKKLAWLKNRKDSVNRVKAIYDLMPYDKTRQIFDMIIKQNKDDDSNINIVRSNKVSKATLYRKQNECIEWIRNMYESDNSTLDLMQIDDFK